MEPLLNERRPTVARTACHCAFSTYRDAPPGGLAAVAVVLLSPQKRGRGQLMEGAGRKRIPCRSLTAINFSTESSL